MKKLIKNFPCINIDIRILNIFGYVTSGYRKIIFLLPLSSHYLFQIIFLSHNIANFQFYVINIFFFLAFTSLMTRLIFYVLQQRKNLYNFLEKCGFIYMKLLKSDDTEISEIMQNFNKSAIMNSKWIASNTIMMTLSYMLLFIKPTNLPLIDIEIPGANVHEYPYLQIAVFIEIFNSFGVSATFGSYTSLNSILINFGVAQLKCLQIQLNRINEYPEDNHKVEQSLKTFVLSHNEVISYFAELNNLLQNMLLSDFILGIVIQCFNLFLLSTSSEIFIMCLASFVIVASFSQTFPVYNSCQHIIDESTAIADIIYNGEWLKMNLKLRKELIFIMMRAQRPICLTMGSIFPIKIGFFQSYLNTCYSYYTIVSQMYK